MQALKQNKILLSLFVVSLLTFVIYKVTGVEDEVVIDPLLVGNQVVMDQTTTEILNLLSRMQQASIDGEIFSSTAWKNLVDQSVVLPTDTPGRPDLFTGALRSQGQFVSTTSQR